MPFKFAIPQMSRALKIFFASAIFLILYGYGCRVFHFYFFWESEMIGWVLLFTAVLFFLIGRQRRDKRSGKKTVGYKIGIGVMGFILIGGSVAYIFMPFTDAFKAAKVLVTKNPDVNRRIGEVRSVILVPYSYYIHMESTERGDSQGEAEFSLLVHGTMGIADIDVCLNKDWKTDWVLSVCSVGDQQ